MDIPTTLKHKPVITVSDYEKVDGRYAYDSDAKGLSVGLAQWNDRGKVEISAKVWRYTGEKWSRQSEDLPLHRVLDLAILICRTREYMMEAYRMEHLHDPDHPIIERIGLQGDAMTVAVCTENEKIESDLALVRDVIAQDDELISERMQVLATILARTGFSSHSLS